MHVKDICTESRKTAVEHHGVAGQGWRRRAERAEALLADAARREAGLRERFAGLHEELVVAQGALGGLRQQLAGRDATIKALEVARDAAQARIAELAEAPPAACASSLDTIAECDLYRAALLEIETVLHRFGAVCGCAGRGNGQGGLG